MSNRQIQERTFIPGNYQNPILDLAEVLATKQTKIKICIHRSVLGRALEFCAYENFVSDGADHYIASFLFIKNEYHYNILLGAGDECESLEPLHIRTEMKRRIHDIAVLYDSLSV